MECMKFQMFRRIFKQFKIFYSIIVFYFVDMVYDFFGPEVSSNMIFHYKTMPINMTGFCRKWMIRKFDKFIFSCHAGNAASPSMTFFSFLRERLPLPCIKTNKFIITRNTETFSRAVFSVFLVCRELFITIFTDIYSFSHNKRSIS